MADKKKSTCVFCGSTTHGRTCPFGPKKTHFHNSTDACGWCGSKTLHGPGCPFNPFTKYHQTGLAFVPMALEAVESGITRGILMRKLSENIVDTGAFKLGLIDEHGNQLRDPENIVERQAYTTSDKYILKLRKLCENSIDFLNISLYLENNDNYTVDELKEIYPLELECEAETQELVSSLCRLSEKYSKLGLSSSKIEKIIAESFISAKSEAGDYSE